MWHINDGQQELLRAFYILLIVSYIGVIAYSIHNVVRYYSKLQQWSWIIWAFYILLCMESLFYIIVFVLLSIKPSESPFYYDDDMDNSLLHKWIIVFEIVGQQTFQLFYILLLFITVQLSLSLRVLLRWSNIE